MLKVTDNNSASTPLLSLCIPTYGVVEWVLPVLESIYSQGCEKNKFEVVVTDNGRNSALEDAISKYDYPNLRYYRTSSPGFTNQIDAFRKGTGLFCKMINHRSKLLAGSLEKMLRLVERYKDEKPILYFADGVIDAPAITECKNVDDFCSKLSYYTSWSNGVGIWREDLQNLDESKICNMFPHLVFLFYLRKQSRYVIWNEKFDVQTDDRGKGGYNIIYTFAVVFLDEMHKLVQEGRLSDNNFNKIRIALLPFLSQWYRFEYLASYTTHNFIIKDTRKYLSKYYSFKEYLKFLYMSWHGVRALYQYHSNLLHKSVWQLLYNRLILGKVIHDV